MEDWVRAANLADFPGVKQGRESGGSWFETCSGVWYPRRRPCGVAINTLVDLNKLAGETPSFF